MRFMFPRRAIPESKFDATTKVEGDFG